MDQTDLLTITKRHGPDWRVGKPVDLEAMAKRVRMPTAEEFIRFREWAMKEAARLKLEETK